MLNTKLKRTNQTITLWIILPYLTIFIQATHKSENNRSSFTLIFKNSYQMFCCMRWNEDTASQVVEIVYIVLTYIFPPSISNKVPQCLDRSRNLPHLFWLPLLSNKQRIYQQAFYFLSRILFIVITRKVYVNLGLPKINAHQVPPNVGNL